MLGSLLKVLRLRQQVGHAGPRQILRPHTQSLGGASKAPGLIFG
jgi:hypothetical protein